MAHVSFPDQVRALSVEQALAHMLVLKQETRALMGEMGRRLVDLLNREFSSL